MNDYVSLDNRLDNDNDSISMVLTVAKQLSDTSNYTRTCVVAIEDFVNYYVMFYQGFYGWVDFAQSFFSNLIKHTFTL